MFTGIIEATGTVRKVSEAGQNMVFWIESPLAAELRPDQSLAHNGVCLTVEEVAMPLYKVTAVRETLSKTNLGNWTAGTVINLERCLRLDSRLDGHIVQGHVDATAECSAIRTAEGSTELSFIFDEAFSHLVIEKGSIAVNGVSLTCFHVKPVEFTVAIIPFTWEHTNLKSLVRGDLVNIEFDILGKYLAKLHEKNMR